MMMRYGGSMGPAVAPCVPGHRLEGLWRGIGAHYIKSEGDKMKRSMSVMVTVILLLPGCGRMVKVPDQERMIRQVYSVGLNKDEIYNRALEWCAKNLSSVNDDIIVKDKEKGKIIAKGTGKYSEYFDFLVDREFSFNISIEARDGRYRVTYDNFIVYYDERQLKSSRAEFKFEINKIKKQIDRQIEALRDYVARGTTEKEIKKEEEEW
jgi:hypothetical protein